MWSAAAPFFTMNAMTFCSAATPSFHPVDIDRMVPSTKRKHQDAEAGSVVHHVRCLQSRTVVVQGRGGLGGTTRSTRAR